MYVKFGAASEFRVRFRASKIGINTSNFLLTIPRRILCCIYALLLGGGFICDVFFMSLFVLHRSFFWCLGKAMLCICGISCVSSLFFFFRKKLP